MKKPSKKEVKQYFKNALTVDSPVGSFDGKIKLKSIRWYDQEKEKYIVCDCNNAVGVITLWSHTDGFSKILTYKDPKEESFVISREQIYDLCHPSLKTNRELLEVYFPKAFEPEKKELVVGKWYKTTENDCIFFLNKKNKKSLYGYGISYEGNWKDAFVGTDDGCKYEATQQEVEKALKAEILKRYKVGDRVNCLKCGSMSLNCELNLDSFDHYFKDDELWVSFNEGKKIDSMVCVYLKGIFAEIIQPKKMTKAEIETELGYNIEIV